VSFVLVWTSRYMPNPAPSDPVGATSLDESADAWRCGGHGFLERYWTIRGFLTFPFAFSQENDSCQDENWLLPIMAPNKTGINSTILVLCPSETARTRFRIKLYLL
jgi:hypothetical protein